VSLFSQTRRLRALCDDLNQLRSIQWPDSAGDKYAQQHLLPLEELLDAYQQALARYDSEAADAFSRLLR
jgi:hypothetical protein